MDEELPDIVVEIISELIAEGYDPADIEEAMLSEAFHGQIAELSQRTLRNAAGKASQEAQALHNLRRDPRLSASGKDRVTDKLLKREKFADKAMRKCGEEIQIPELVWDYLNEGLEPEDIETLVLTQVEPENELDAEIVVKQVEQAVSVFLAEKEGPHLAAMRARRKANEPNANDAMKSRLSKWSDVEKAKHAEKEKESATKKAEESKKSNDRFKEGMNKAGERAKGKAFGDKMASVKVPEYKKSKAKELYKGVKGKLQSAIEARRAKKKAAVAGKAQHQAAKDTRANKPKDVKDEFKGGEAARYRPEHVEADNEVVMEGKVKLQPGMTKAAFDAAKNKVTMVSGSNKPAACAPSDEDSDEGKMLSKMLKGHYPWGSMSSGTANRAISKIRTLDPRKKSGAMKACWGSEAGFTKFIKTGEY
jgi:hypothetical protein